MTEGFDPAELLRALDDAGVEFVLIGGLAATLYGSPHVTTDADVVPSRGRENLRKLANALRILEAKIRVDGEPDGLPFSADADLLERSEILSLSTKFGDLDLTFVPSGTQGYDDLRRGARTIEVHGIQLQVASLSDVIRSKEAANREKDRLVLPTLRKLLERLDQ